MRRHRRHIIAMAILSLLHLPASAQEQQSDTTILMPGETPKPTKYIAVEQEEEHLVLFQGFTLSADVFGLVQYAVSDYGSLEAALRLNLKNTYFPIVEAGYGISSIDDYNTKVKYKVNAPYLRAGLDYNVLKNKFQDNRLYVGLRYGISIFNYDISGPAMTDPIWGGSEPFSIDGIKCTSHWAEVVLGAEVQIYKNFHMGWSVRYKSELASTKSDYSKPSCIPGYGKTTTSTCWGGTYSLIFDLNWGKKKSHKQRMKVSVTDLPAEEKTITDEPDTQDETGNSADGETEESSGIGEGDERSSGIEEEEEAAE